MKKILVLAILAILVSCTPNSNKGKIQFRGFGELLIGKSFDSVKSKAQFTKIDDDAYYSETYKISNSIGYVNKVIVLLENDKIYDVAFESSKDTHINVIDNFLSSENIICINDKNHTYYKSLDDSVGFVKKLSNSKNNVNLLEFKPTKYFYCDLTYDN